VGVVLALAGDLEVLLRDRPGRLLAPLRTLLAARKLALRPPESLRRLLQALWNYPEVANSFLLRDRNPLHCSFFIIRGAQVA
jgi:hypothetical protein